VVTNYNKIENDDNSAKHLTNTLQPATRRQMFQVHLYTSVVHNIIIISAGATEAGSGDSARASELTSESIYHIIYSIGIRLYSNTRPWYRYPARLETEFKLLLHHSGVSGQCPRNVKSALG